MSTVGINKAGQRIVPVGQKCHRNPARVLVVEDCEAVARITALVLRDMGHEAIIANSGEEAVELFVSEGPINLLVTDVVLPGCLCGYELAEVLTARQPKLPVIFFTGYPVDTISQENGYSSDFPHLIKPAMITEIRDAVLASLES